MVIPTHVGLIMDGNGRWARQRGLPRSAGHRAGIAHVPAVVAMCTELGVEVVSAYVWSTENWDRPAPEADFLMRSIEEFGPALARDLHAKGVRLVHSGSRAGLSPGVVRVIDEAIALTRHNGPRVLNLAFNYGGRAELVDAARRLIAEGVPPDAITEAAIAARLYMAGLPDIDLVIRSGGDQRLSNFFLWQSATARLYVAQAYWPALERGDIETALCCYDRAVSTAGTADGARGSNRMVTTRSLRAPQRVDRARRAGESADERASGLAIPMRGAEEPYCHPSGA